MTDPRFPDFSFNSLLLLKELENRGVKIVPMKAQYFVQATFNEHTEILYDVNTRKLSSTSASVIDNKFFSKQYLKHLGYQVTQGDAFSRKNSKKAFDIAYAVTYPVVLKPVDTSHGRSVYMNIENKTELKDALEELFKEEPDCQSFLVEKQHQGNEYRLFITKNDFFAVAHRVSARVFGDGKHTIQQLIDMENARRMNPRNTCLCEIPIDSHVEKYLTKNSLSLESVPAKMKCVVLRENSNVSTGGTCIEVTETAHTSFRKFALDILQSFENTPCMGIDILCEDITKPIHEQSYAICELNSSPGLSLHMLPSEGKPQNTASALADCLLPETLHHQFI